MAEAFAALCEQAKSALAYLKESEFAGAYERAVGEKAAA